MSEGKKIAMTGMNNKDFGGKLGKIIKYLKGVADAASKKTEESEDFSHKTRCKRKRRNVESRRAMQKESRKKNRR